jgi:hypothetical protein
MNFDSKTVSIIIAVLVVAGGAYWYFFMNNSESVPLTASLTQTADEAQFQTLATQLQNITFDTSIFTDPRFMALVDISAQITPESTGRLDPFAPVSGVTSKK